MRSAHMKPALEYLPRNKDNSFVVKHFDYKYYPTPWHYHPEYEIVLVTESTGKRFVGDHISTFEPGNLALLGPYIPHTYRNDDSYYAKRSKLKAQSIVIHFLESSIGNDFFTLPESKHIGKLLQNAGCGFDIGGKTNKIITQKLYDIVSLTGMKKWLCLMEILHELAVSKELTPITNMPRLGINEKESDRICRVLDWVTSNYENEIRLSDAAAIAGMSVTSFSRFFSLRTRKAFSHFVQELRLQKASRLLIESDMSVTQICYDCGYNNLSNFNRQFLQHYKLSPLQYKKSYSELE